MSFLALCCLGLLAWVATASPDPIVINNTTRVYVVADCILRVAHTHNSTWPEKQSLSVLSSTVAVAFKTTENATHVQVKTSCVTATGSKSTGQITFQDTATSNTFLSELTHSLTPVTDLGKSTFAISQSWDSSPDEAFYGGGQFQNGYINYKNVPLELVQFNTEAIVPFFVSTRGYGLLWDVYSWSMLNPSTTPVILQTPSQANNYIDGHPVAVVPCESRDHVVNAWIWNANDNSISLQGTNLVLTWSRGGVRLQTKASASVSQQWMQKGSRVMTLDQSLCLQAATNQTFNRLTVRSCDSNEPLQQWRYDPATSRLLLASQVPQSQQPLVPRSHRVVAAADSLCAAPALFVSGTFTPTVTGQHAFSVRCSNDWSSFGCHTNAVSLSILTENGSAINKSVVNWDTSNTPNSLTAKTYLKAGISYQLSLAYASLQYVPTVWVNAPDYSHVQIDSKLSDLIDYYVVNSRLSIDAAIQGYRNLTGPAPIYPLWVYGFWQCKERYHTQAELLASAHGYRDRNIPIDNIVQDWHYWGNLGWGPQWDPSIYPDPAGMVQEVHSLNLQIMVSVWSKFDNNTIFFANMTAIGAMINDTNYYDAYNPAGRDMFYRFSKHTHFDIGVDALWLDATEPENFPNANKSVHLGSGNYYMNPYSLLVATAISEGLERDFPRNQGARVFSLTRSSFAGQQRTGACLWSGDTTSEWSVLERQVSASLNYQLSGIPYWSEDIGGFFRPSNQYTSTDFQNLLIRWFQFGCFTPIYRVHGGNSNTEIWNYGDVVLNVVNATNVLRYQLLPYTYSSFSRAYFEGYTVQRALVFDFSSDLTVTNIADEFMFGPALLIAPVVTSEDNARNARTVYLPRTAGGWFDFHTGSRVSVPSGGGLFIQAPAPIDRIPVFVKGGAIVPMGPTVQYTTQTVASELKVQVYCGDSGEFGLYEDDGWSSDYAASAQHTTIPIAFDQDTQTLTFHKRQGSGFDGMVTNRTFVVTFFGSRQTETQVCVYAGGEVTLQPSFVCE